MAFLESYDALSAIGDPTARAREQVALTRTWLKDRVDELFAELRESRPIFVAPGIACVSRRADVLEVLSQDRVFSVRPYASRMERTSGAFFLGMPDSAQRDRELSIMRLALTREDVPAVRDNAAAECAALVAAARPSGRLDLVDGYARVVAARMVGVTFGTPGPDERTLMGWLRPLFRDIFLNLGDDPTVRAAADAAASDLKAYLLALVAERRSGGPRARPQDALSRLVSMQANPLTSLDDAGIVRNVGGAIIGAVDTVSRAFSQAINQLLDRPEVLAAARRAALDEDHAVVSAALFEAMRFDPQNPFLFRLCESPYLLAKGTDRATLIPQGTLVFAGTKSAMFDRTALDEPDVVRLDRPNEDYVFFGYGPRACFGRHIAPVVMLELAKALLREPVLRRAQGPDGRIVFDGPFPAHFWVEIA
jgi:cytochrome P450